MIRRWPILLLACLVGGCAVTRSGVDTRAILAMSPEELQAVDLVTLCSAHANYARSNEDILAELQRRDLSDREWAAIKAQEVYVGMSEPALVCSWGLPGRCGDVNLTEFRDMIVKQYRYCHGPSGLRTAYVKQGAVVGVQY